jgi:hypothetical protein
LPKLLPFQTNLRLNAIEYQNPKLGILRLWQQLNILKKVKAILITGL